ncbi:MAG: hypothetical protein U9P38_02295 [Campylobacterota bacterium]|nr:hypothetical protein [Campylobacterota bacterium]
MDSETVYAILGVGIFSFIAFKTLSNSETAKTQTKEEKCHEIVNGYRKELREALTDLKEDKEAQKLKKIELLKKFSEELSRNIFFDAFEVREIIEELSGMDI